MSNLMNALKERTGEKDPVSLEKAVNVRLKSEPVEPETDHIELTKIPKNKWQGLIKGLGIKRNRVQGMFCVWDKNLILCKSKDRGSELKEVTSEILVCRGSTKRETLKKAVTALKQIGKKNFLMLINNKSNG